MIFTRFCIAVFGSLLLVSPVAIVPGTKLFYLHGPEWAKDLATELLISAALLCSLAWLGAALCYILVTVPSNPRSTKHVEIHSDAGSQDGSGS